MFFNKKIILWDFDGVILDSNKIRESGFEIVLNGFPIEQVQLLMNYHRKNGGLSRYVKFRYFFENIRKEKVSDDLIYTYASDFSEIMLKKLINPRLIINDSIKFIDQNYKKIEMHIVSGSDQTELRILCKELMIEKYFQSINGSPTPKIELVKLFLDANELPKENLCLIGDSNNDFEAAKINGIDFFGYNNIELSNSKNYIDSFEKITQ